LKKAIVVGGSGMLSKASLWLAENSYDVSIIGRDINKLNRLSSMNENIIPISVDYQNDNDFRKEIVNILSTGPVETIVAWIHGNAPRALETLIKTVNSLNTCKWRLFHVLGSSKNLDEILQQIEVPNGCEYHQVQLGFIIENNGSRWLTNSEISNGVIQSIETNKKRMVVGTLTPWHLKP
jgi:hypothetical protein